jgi:hypothetical protein
MNNHEIHLSHRRYNRAASFGEAPVDSVVEIDVDSTDLTEAWAELFSRMPSDVYAAAKAAMEHR